MLFLFEILRTFLTGMSVLSKLIPIKSKNLASGKSSTILQCTHLRLRQFCFASRWEITQAQRASFMELVRAALGVFVLCMWDRPAIWDRSSANLSELGTCESTKFREPLCKITRDVIDKSFYHVLIYIVFLCAWLIPAIPRKQAAFRF